MEFIGDEKNRAIWNQHFIQVKSQIKQPKRTHTAHITTAKGGYSYKYADLADVDKSVMDACRAVKDKDGNVAFAYYFDIDNTNKGVSVQTVMVDTSGTQMITDKVWFGNEKSGDAQQTASLISYAKRYSLSAAFGVASEEDDDAQNLKPQDTRKRVVTLDKDELDKFKVNVYGKKLYLKDIWQDYIENEDPETMHWLLAQKDPQTLQAIKQLLDQYNLKKRIKEVKYKNLKKVEGQEIKKNKGSEKIAADDDEKINKLVDGSTDNEIENLF